MKIAKKFPKKFIIPSVILVVLLVSGITFAVNINNKPHKVASVTQTKSEVVAKPKGAQKVVDEQATVESTPTSTQTQAQPDSSEQAVTDNESTIPTFSSREDMLRYYGVPEANIATAAQLTSITNVPAMQSTAMPGARTAECRADQYAMVKCYIDYVNSAYSGSWDAAIQAYAKVQSGQARTW